MKLESQNSTDNLLATFMPQLINSLTQGFSAMVVSKGLMNLLTPPKPTAYITSGSSSKTSSEQRAQETKNRLFMACMMLPVVPALLFKPRPVIDEELVKKTKREFDKYPKGSPLNPGAQFSKRAPKPPHYKSNKRNILNAG